MDRLVHPCPSRPIQYLLTTVVKVSNLVTKLPIYFGESHRLAPPICRLATWYVLCPVDLLSRRNLFDTNNFVTRDLLGNERIISREWIERVGTEPNQDPIN